MIIQGADIPLYVQMKSLIRSQIASGQLSPHDALPGERELVEIYGLSRTTVRQAIGELVLEGVLYRRHGKGTFVAPRKFEQNLARLTGFAEELRQQGLAPVIRVLASEMRKPSPEVADQLGLQGDRLVAYIKRLVLTDGEPLFIDRTYLVAPLGEMVLAGDLQSESIYATIERVGYPIREGAQTIGATALSDPDAKLLEVDPGSPALHIRRSTFIESESPVEYAEALYRADRFQYQTKLQRRSPSLDG